MGNPVDSVKTWLLRVALKKVLTRAIPWVTALIMTLVTKANAFGAGVGVQLSVDDVALATGIAAALTMFQNWLKVKFDLKFL
ncbi:MAG: hypothetical protein EKK55_17250 [Rhodocyclaceae bacterium]|nr:MAG: hypothetical protein EKK55_17250 [Rhodocyclaceae bacterium]